VEAKVITSYTRVTHRTEDKRHELPTGEVYKTPHSGERHWRTANENLILLTEVGSRLHGTGIDSDDQDMQGVCIEPPVVMLGTNSFEQYEYRTQPVGARSGPGDIDLNVYGMAKWVRLIINGNPSHLLPLFAPEDLVYAMNWAGHELRLNRDLVLARQHAKRFLGYLNKQRQHLVGDLAPRTNRPELVAEHGFDTKYAYHALRIAMQGIELMRDGTIHLPMVDHERKYLLDVREGRYTLTEVLEKLGRLESELVYTADHTVRLPERVDTDYVNGWLTDVYRRWWKEKGL
jgi:predicted nucleotidyltransferase